jgi:hypothetical protein
MPTPPDTVAEVAPVADQSVWQRKRKMLLHTALYVLGGGAVGFAYHKLVGCSSGACPITANPYIATLYGALIGLVAGGGVGR